MSSTKLTIHDAPRSLYDALGVKEENAEGTYWKCLKTESIEIVYFGGDDESETDA